MTLPFKRLQRNVLLGFFGSLKLYFLLKPKTLTFLSHTDIWFKPARRTCLQTIAVHPKEQERSSFSQSLSSEIHLQIKIFQGKELRKFYIILISNRWGPGVAYWGRSGNNPFFKKSLFPCWKRSPIFLTGFYSKIDKKKSGELLPDIHVKLQASENVKRLLNIDLVFVLKFRVLIRTIKLH